MITPPFSQRRALAAPKRLREGGFTLLEIMIVVSIITILSFLAMIAIGKVRDRAVRSLIANNLRQFYDAKEYYFSESGSTKMVAPMGLLPLGYVRPSLVNAYLARQSMESNLGWHYQPMSGPGERVFAYQGVLRPTDSTPTGEAIYYPADAGAAQSAQKPAVQAATFPAPPSGFVGGSSPGAPWLKPPVMDVNLFRAFSNIANGHHNDVGLSDQTILLFTGPKSPDGQSPVRVTRVEFIDPAKGAFTRNAQGDGFDLDWRGHGNAAYHLIRITVANDFGETSVLRTFMH